MKNKGSRTLTFNCYRTGMKKDGVDVRTDSLVLKVQIEIQNPKEYFVYKVSYIYKWKCKP